MADGSHSPWTVCTWGLNVVSCITLLYAASLLPVFGQRLTSGILGGVYTTYACSLAWNFLFGLRFILLALSPKGQRGHIEEIAAVVGGVSAVLAPLFGWWIAKWSGRWIETVGEDRLIWGALGAVSLVVILPAMLLVFAGMGCLNGVVKGWDWKGYKALFVSGVALVDWWYSNWDRSDRGWVGVYERILACALLGVGCLLLVSGFEKGEALDKGIKKTGGRKGGRRRKGKSRLGMRNWLIRLTWGSRERKRWLLCVLIGLCFLGRHWLARQVIGVREKLKSRLPENLIVLDKVDSITGKLGVFEKDFGEYKARFLTCDHSVLGGRFLVAEGGFESVFKQFYVHEAVRLTRKPGESADKCFGDGAVACVEGKPAGGREGRALILGAGVGIVADGMAKLGSKVDLVEIDPTVITLAYRYFRLSIQRERVFAEDALDFIARQKSKILANREVERYDYVIHDMFTGGSVPSKLFRPVFFRNVKFLMKTDGVLALNFVGDVHGPAEVADGILAVLKLLADTWEHVRLFSDEHEEAKMHNYVLFASDAVERVTFRKPVLRDGLDSGMRLNALETFETGEVKNTTRLLDQYRNAGHARDAKSLSAAQWATAATHWKVMRTLFPAELWEYLA